MNGSGVADLLVDTDVLIDHLRGIRRLRVPSRKVVMFSVITRCELLSGRGTDEDAVHKLLSAFAELDVDRPTAERAGRLRRHVDIRVPDALIAATALERGLSLMTNNLRHYRVVPGLRLVKGA